MKPDDLVALAVSLELANPEGAGVESWRKEPFTSQLPIELVQELTDVCAEKGWDSQSFVETVLRRFIEPPERARGSGRGPQRDAGGDARDELRADARAG